MAGYSVKRKNHSYNTIVLGLPRELDDERNCLCSLVLGSEGMTDEFHFI